MCFHARLNVQDPAVGAPGEIGRAVQADDRLAGAGRAADPGGAGPVAAHQCDLVGVEEGHPLLDRGPQRLFQGRLSQAVDVEQAIGGLFWGLGP
ncbi:hypothetical protein OG883_33710 [Streptomyces sp. NBC_01142]|uniref:hypothetical protein n=1 Tax=Streptomyces sp. NBC_01142 TaxID=2975865 RepID=UPI0022592035|nr:hypothetical protein [Streptomyces sp. NBC_01142]MCX4824728.1 hypothetical protein [Streptomyces sp. NBC_01142]